MSEGVDDTSAQQGGTNATNPHAAWARAGKDRQAAKRADEAHAREAVQRVRLMPPPDRRGPSRADAYERSLRSNREAKMLQRKLKAAGLPPKNVKRSPARERRAHEAEAEQFYERLQTPAERKRLMDGYRPLDEATLASWRERSPLARRRDAQLSRFRRGLDRAAGGAEQIREEARMDSIAHAHRGRGPLDVDAELRQRVFDAAGGREYLAAGGDRHTASVLVEEALEGHAPAVTRPDGHGMVWVPEHTRAGREIAGHWRRRPGG